MRLATSSSTTADCTSHAGDKVALGDTWVHRGFEYQCSAGGRSSTTACVTEKGTRVPVGAKRKEGRFVANCLDQGGGKVSFRMELAEDADCVDNLGNRFAFGHSWLDSFNFNMTCAAKGTALYCMTT